MTVARSQLVAGIGRIKAVAIKEFRHLRRDELSRAMILGIPLVMTLLFGYAINHDVRHLVAGVVDSADTSTSRLLVAKMQATRVVDVLHRFDSVVALESAMDRGDVSVGIVVPRDFERRVQRRDRAIAQLLIDGSDPVVQSVARGLAQLPVAELGASAPRIEMRVRYNPERRSPVFIVPGIVGVILNLTMVLFTAVAIVRERERGNMELLITTPIRGLELMIGKITPYMIIGFVQASIIIGLGVWLFDVPVHGSIVDFYGGVGLFVIATLTLGLVISTLATNQFQAFQMTFMSFLPQMLLSGFMFPFEGMPLPAQWLAELFPLTHFLRIVRGVMLRQADLELMWQDVWPLLAFFLVFLMLATLRFRKRLD
ncbi:MAG: ABC transporter permease [Gammaproteobacteria bacterium]